MLAGSRRLAHPLSPQKGRSLATCIAHGRVWALGGMGKNAFAVKPLSVGTPFPKTVGTRKAIESHPPETNRWCHNSPLSFCAMGLEQLFVGFAIAGGALTVALMTTLLFV